MYMALPPSLVTMYIPLLIIGLPLCSKTTLALPPLTQAWTVASCVSAPRLPWAVVLAV